MPKKPNPPQFKQTSPRQYGSRPRWTVLQKWFDACVRKGGETPTKEAYANYVAYCERENEEPINVRVFGIALCYFMEVPRKSEAWGSVLNIGLIPTYAQKGYVPPEHRVDPEDPSSPKRKSARTGGRAGRLFGR